MLKICRISIQSNRCSSLLDLDLIVFGSDVVETITFETETETWLKFRDEIETSSKTPRPRLKTCSSIPRLDTSKFVHFAEFFQKMSSSLLTMGVRRGETGIYPLEIETKRQDSPENMKLVAQFRSID